MKLSAMNRAGHRSNGLQERVFSISQARRALMYLQSVLADAVDAYQRAQEARHDLASDAPRESRSALCERRDAAIARLNRTIDECHAVGVCMVDIANGSLSMKVRDDGVFMCLIWRLGEPVEVAWSEFEAAVSVANEPHYAARHG